MANTIEALKAFLANYPEHRRQANAHAILKRIAKAKYSVSYPKRVTVSYIPDGRQGFQWNTVFHETSGHSGYSVTATNFYIQAPSGSRFTNSWSQTVDVRAGRTGVGNYWLDEDRKWNGGTFHATWVGHDDYGNPIEIVQVVRLVR